jgi:ATP-dependent DNA ligase
MARVLRSVSLLALSRWRATCFESESNDAQWESNRPAASVKTTKRLENQKRTEPAFIEPMQCKPVTALPTDENWTFEIKFDGYRSIAVKRRSEVTLFSRNEKVLDRRFPKVVEALASLAGDFVLDGELVVFDSQGRPSFQLLQNNLSRALPVYFYAFDLLNRDGELLVNLPIERRRELLGRMLPEPEDPLRLSPLLPAPSGQVLDAVRKLGLEGIVANGSIPSTNQASDHARESSIAQTLSRSSPSAAISPKHAASMRLSSAFMKKEFVFVCEIEGRLHPANSG